MLYDLFAIAVGNNPTLEEINYLKQTKRYNITARIRCKGILHIFHR